MAPRRITPRRLWPIFLVAGLMLFSGPLVFLVPLQDPPAGALTKAESALKAAGQASAGQYAEDLYAQADNTLKLGRLEMARQDGRPALLRDYTTADSLLQLAANLGHQAARKAQRDFAIRDSLILNAQVDLKEKVSNLREALEKSLLSSKTIQYVYQADLCLSMSRRLRQDGELESALQALESGKTSLLRLDEILDAYSQDKAQGLPTWRKWVEQTLTSSRRQKTWAVVVDKSAHQLYLVKSGDLVSTYPCEVGRNSAHQKLIRGDGSTPEGLYRVSAIKLRGSKHYKALLLDYPNAMDRKRFQENKDRGLISKQARIGGLIEIHGNGGQEKDWTDGCIALKNEDMDHLLQYAAVGMPVTIVRSSDRWP